MKKTKRSLLLCFMLLMFSFIMAVSACGGSKKVEFKFDTQGGDPVASVTLDVGDEFTLPTPVWEGHGFEGWFDNADGSGDQYVTVTAEKSMTFYAKWSALSVITLELDGGSLAEVSGGKLYLKAGEDLYNFMAAYKPTKTDCEFAEWYVGETALTRNTTMPEAGITLTAHYKVKYTVETYLQKLDELSEYERGEDIVGFEYAGTNFTPDPSVKGFKVVQNENELTTKELKTTSSENVYRFYFDREEFSVVFRSNYPAAAGMEDVLELRPALYGKVMELPVDYAVPEGYCLIGWSRTPDGEAEYEVGYIESKLFHGEKTPAPFIAVEDDLVLFAVWERGYTNLFESKDYVYIFEDEETAYLERGGVFFAGEYNARRGSFTFRDESGKVILEGTLRGDGTFAYYDVDREGYAALYTLDRGIIETTRIFFNAYDQITYSVEDENGVTSTSEGTYRLDESGYYVATFTTGDMSGRTIYFDKASVTVNGSSRTIFQIRNEEEFALGELVRFVLVDGKINYYTGGYQLTLNGMNVCSIFTGSGYEYYYYIKQDDLIAIYDTNLSLLEVYKLLKMDNVLGYMPYYSTIEGEFTAESGATLTLDGLYNATYTEGDISISGYYTLSSSLIDGYIVLFYGADDTTRIFRATVTTETIGNNRVTVRNFEEKGAGYAEFYFKNDNPDAYLYYAPLVVLDEKKAGDLTVYGMNSVGNFVKIASGSYTRDEESGCYLAVLDSHEDVETLEMPVDVASVESFVFDVTAVFIFNNYYYVTYWYSIMTQNGPTDYDKVYLEEDGDSTLTTIATFVILEFDGYTIMGMYEMDDNIMTASFSTNSSILYLSFEINEEAGTFIWLKDILGSAAELLADGTTDVNQVLTFDGKGGVTYTIKNGDDVTTYEGKYVKTERVTIFDEPIYEFRAEEMTFEFILVSTSAASYFARYNEAYNGEYTGTYQGDTLILELDGYSYMATLTIFDTPYTGIYYLPEDNVVCLIIGSTALYFDLGKDRTFTMRSTEYGTYLLYDNQTYGEIFITLDGYGKLTVFCYQETEGGESERVELGVGRYFINPEGLWEISYEKENGERWARVGVLGTLVISSNAYPAFIVMYGEVVYNYVIESDWSILMLDGFGNAKMINAMGEEEYGSYMLITDSLLYYVNNAGTEANVYQYDKATATAVRMIFDQIGYYTEDLESLLFTNYGFMIMGGQTRYYYNIVDGNVLIYHVAGEGEVGNEYGYVEENFGSFENKIEWKDKSYFQNNGYALMFKRAETGSDKYPVPMRVNGEMEKFALENLVFTPSGNGAAFRVNGSVTINGTNYNCVVSRIINEEGNPEMYITLGSYVFGISIKYLGMNDDGSTASSYEIISMRTEVGLYSNNYLYLVLLYAMNGKNYGANDFGYITIIDEYNEAGDVIEEQRYVNGVFYEKSFMKDTGGNLVSADRLLYTLENSVYTVEIAGKDGYLYRLYFEISTELYNYFGVYAYTVKAFSRVEAFELDGGYRVEIERALVSDLESVKEGSLLSVKLFKGEKLLVADFSFIREGVLYYLVMDEEKEGYTEITYFIIELAENIPDVPVEEGESSVYTYKSATLKQIKDAERYYSGKLTFVDFDAETDEALLIVLNNAVFFVDKTEWNEDGSYLLTSVTGVKFHVVKGGAIGIIDDSSKEE